ncbi:DUF4390 domain-containing protein [Undibacterium terreum]|uniref:DUF4390 domain-containing protein n=1 Tax=Undibacterium terreum TaxID=1224302 RepID=A0A916UYD7_9BURK|nr:DUF4390 domain-containing protein [Undibacterium terreum]GGC93836.1 hypothetical protein GCM10011396_46450 [Undibacterium terreum]
MIRRPVYLLMHCLLALLLLLQAPAQAANAEVTTARIESSEEGYRIFAGFSFELSHALEDAITRGIPMYFMTEVELTRPRWYWFDEKAINSTQTVKISYNVWTRQYTSSSSGSLPQNFTTLEEAMNTVLRPRRWVVAEKSDLTSGATYNVAVRLKLDLGQVPKQPLLINALNNSDWRLSSEWKRFTFKADEK